MDKTYLKELLTIAYNLGVELKIPLTPNYGVKVLMFDQSLGVKVSKTRCFNIVYFNTVDEVCDYLVHVSSVFPGETLLQGEKFK